MSRMIKVLSESPSLKAIMLIFCVGFLASCGFVDTSPAQSVPVRHNGRIKPFDSFARQTLKLVTGSETWNRKSATRVLSETAPERMAGLKWIRIDHRGLKEYLGLGKDEHFFTLTELEPKADAVEELVRKAKEKRDADVRPLKIEQKGELLYSQMMTVKRLSEGTASTPVPAAEYTGAVRRKISLEVFYNQSRPFELAAGCYLIGFLFVLFRRNRLGTGLELAGIVFHTLGLLLRVAVLSRPPVSNMYESMIFMNWALIVFAAVFSLLRRDLLALNVGAALSGMVMIYANLLPIDSSLDVLVPVLRSNYWLSVHVLTVVSSYGAFGLAMALGHRHLWAESRGRFSKKLNRSRRI